MKSIYLHLQYNLLAMETMNRTQEFDRLAFTVLAIEASAQKMV